MTINAAVKMTPRAGGETYILKKGQKDEVKTKFRLTDPDHLKHDEGASVASLRP